MTYPQQPDQQPYGQQPGWPPAPGPGGGYQQHGQFPYPGGPPPRKNGRTGLLVGIGVVVVALAVFTVTAFVAPGFLLGDKESGGTPTSAQEGGGCGKGGSPAADDGEVVDGSAQKVNALVSKIVQGFCDQDEEALTRLICPGSEPAVQGYVDEADLVEEFELSGKVKDEGPTATAKVHAVLLDGKRRIEADMVITLAYGEDDFCWDDMEAA